MVVVSPIIWSGIEARLNPIRRIALRRGIISLWGQRIPLRKRCISPISIRRTTLCTEWCSARIIVRRSISSLCLRILKAGSTPVSLLGECLGLSLCHLLGFVSVDEV